MKNKKTTDKEIQTAVDQEVEKAKELLAKAEQEKMNAFIKEYNEFCAHLKDKYGYEARPQTTMVAVKVRQ